MLEPLNPEATTAAFRITGTLFLSGAFFAIMVMLLVKLFEDVKSKAFDIFTVGMFVTGVGMMAFGALGFFLTVIWGSTA